MYAEAVPVARHALSRISHLLDIVEASGRAEALLSARLSEDMWPCRGQLASATGFVLRATLPLAGREVPVVTLDSDLAALRRKVTEAAALLDGLDAADFAGAAQREVAHRAGFADLRQSGADYLRLFAFPNLWFHVAMAYAVLRAEGVEIGKEDYDGQHRYRKGFRF
ncbi:DUF1993 family protein [Oceaniglobus roseus]|uniref:DUF1993 family protein n=1 Tax=Oceaniglobus roseus TaxID=1737570 RepID=UPI000C7F29F0|nr:DUF1993 domain-containing protein [Kandeliimicrobium roseum]